MAEVACVVDCPDQLGESPVWCPQDQRLYWLDIKGQTISWFAPAAGEYRQVPVDEQPGSLVLREKGGMVVAFYGGFRFFDPETGAVETIHEVEKETPESRMNDGRCDRQGHFWADSMDDAMTGRPRGSALSARPRPQPAQVRERHRRLQLDRLQHRGRHHVLR